MSPDPPRENLRECSNCEKKVSESLGGLNLVPFWM
jgi:hypothetical protein